MLGLIVIKIWNSKAQNKMCFHCVQGDRHVCHVTSPQSASHFFVAEAYQVTGWFIISGYRVSW